MASGTTNCFLAGERYSRDPAVSDANLASRRGWGWTDWNSSGDVLCDVAFQLNSTYAQMAQQGAGAAGLTEERNAFLGADTLAGPTL